MQMRRLDIETEKVYYALQKAKGQLKDFTETHGLEDMNYHEAVESLKQMGTEGEKAFKKVSTGAKKSGNIIEKFINRIKRLALRVFLFSLITKAFRSMVDGVKEGFKNLAQYSDKFNDTISAFKSQSATLKNALATAFEPIVSSIIPYLTKLVSWLVEASNKVAMFFSALQGKTTFTKAKEQIVDYAKSVKDATEKLASFDDINVLKNDTASSGGEVTGAEAFETAEIEQNVSNLAEKIKGIATDMKNAFASFLGDTAIPSFVNTLSSAFNGLKQTINALSPSLSYIWKDLFVPLGKFIGETLVVVLKLVGQAFTELASAITSKSTDINRILIVLVKALQTVGTVLKGVIQFASGVLSGLVTTVARVVARIISIFGYLLDFLKGVFTLNWDKIWKSLVNIVISVFNLVIDVVEGSINAIIRGINSLAFTVPSWVPKIGGEKIGFSLNEISWGRITPLATGGIVDRPTNALIGESGREAVVPLENNTEWMDVLTERLGGAQTVTLKFEGSLAQLGKVLKPVLDAESSRIGTRLVVE